VGVADYLLQFFLLKRDIDMKTLLLTIMVIFLAGCVSIPAHPFYKTAQLYHDTKSQSDWADDGIDCWKRTMNEREAQQCMIDDHGWHE